uniref:Putative chloroplast RF2 n=2 Tax=Isoetes TaxID=13838 RepID=A0A2U8KJG9_9TRAC|nr:putative chloroplast RF2 [Isoetes piedmontana]
MQKPQQNPHWEKACWDKDHQYLLNRYLLNLWTKWNLGLLTEIFSNREHKLFDFLFIICSNSSHRIHIFNLVLLFISLIFPYRSSKKSVVETNYLHLSKRVSVTRMNHSKCERGMQGESNTLKKKHACKKDNKRDNRIISEEDKAAINKDKNFNIFSSGKGYADFQIYFTLNSTENKYLDCGKNLSEWLFQGEYINHERINEQLINNSTIRRYFPSVLTGTEQDKIESNLFSKFYLSISQESFAKDIEYVINNLFPGEREILIENFPKSIRYAFLDILLIEKLDIDFYSTKRSIKNIKSSEFFGYSMRSDDNNRIVDVWNIRKSQNICLNHFVLLDAGPKITRRNKCDINILDLIISVNRSTCWNILYPFRSSREDNEQYINIFYNFFRSESLVTIIDRFVLLITEPEPNEFRDHSYKKLIFHVNHIMEEFYNEIYILLSLSSNDKNKLNDRNSGFFSCISPNKGITGENNEHLPWIIREKLIKTPFRESLERSYIADRETNKFIKNEIHIHFKELLLNRSYLIKKSYFLLKNQIYVLWIKNEGLGNVARNIINRHLFNWRGTEKKCFNYSKVYKDNKYVNWNANVCEWSDKTGNFTEFLKNFVSSKKNFFGIVYNEMRSFINENSSGRYVKLNNNYFKFFLIRKNFIKVFEFLIYKFKDFFYTLSSLSNFIDTRSIYSKRNVLDNRELEFEFLIDEKSIAPSSPNRISVDQFIIDVFHNELNNDIDCIEPLATFFSIFKNQDNLNPAKLFNESSLRTYFCGANTLEFSDYLNHLQLDPNKRWSFFFLRNTKKNPIRNYDLTYEQLLNILPIYIYPSSIVEIISFLSEKEIFSIIRSQISEISSPEYPKRGCDQIFAFVYNLYKLNSLTETNSFSRGKRNIDFIRNFPIIAPLTEKQIVNFEITYYYQSILATKEFDIFLGKRTLNPKLSLIQNKSYENNVLSEIFGGIRSRTDGMLYQIKELFGRDSLMEDSRNGIENEVMDRERTNLNLFNSFGENEIISLSFFSPHLKELVKEMKMYVISQKDDVSKKYKLLEPYMLWFFTREWWEYFYNIFFSEAFSRILLNSNYHISRTGDVGKIRIEIGIGDQPNKPLFNFKFRRSLININHWNDEYLLIGFFILVLLLSENSDHIDLWRRFGIFEYLTNSLQKYRLDAFMYPHLDTIYHHSKYLHPWVLYYSTFFYWIFYYLILFHHLILPHRIFHYLFSRRNKYIYIYNFIRIRIRSFHYFLININYFWKEINKYLSTNEKIKIWLNNNESPDPFSIEKELLIRSLITEKNVFQYGSNTTYRNSLNNYFGYRITNKEGLYYLVYLAESYKKDLMNYPLNQFDSAESRVFLAFQQRMTSLNLKSRMISAPFELGLSLSKGILLISTTETEIERSSYLIEDLAVDSCVSLIQISMRYLYKEDYSYRCDHYIIENEMTLFMRILCRLISILEAVKKMPPSIIWIKNIHEVNDIIVKTQLEPSKPSVEVLSLQLHLLLISFTEIANNTSSSMIVIGSTHLPEKMDPSLICPNRLDRLINVRMLSISEQQKGFPIPLRSKCSSHLENIDWSFLNEFGYGTFSYYALRDLESIANEFLLFGISRDEWVFCNNKIRAFFYGQIIPNDVFYKAFVDRFFDCEKYIDISRNYEKHLYRVGKAIENIVIRSIKTSPLCEGKSTDIFLKGNFDDLFKYLESSITENTIKEFTILSYILGCLAGLAARDSWFISEDKEENSIFFEDEYENSFDIACSFSENLLVEFPWLETHQDNSINNEINNKVRFASHPETRVPMIIMQMQKFYTFSYRRAVRRYGMATDTAFTFNKRRLDFFCDNLYWIGIPDKFFQFESEIAALYGKNITKPLFCFKSIFYYPFRYGYKRFSYEESLKILEIIESQMEEVLFKEQSVIFEIPPSTKYQLSYEPLLFMRKRFVWDPTDLSIFEKKPPVLFSLRELFVDKETIKQLYIIYEEKFKVLKVGRDFRDFSVYYKEEEEEEDEENLKDENEDEDEENLKDEDEEINSKSKLENKFERNFGVLLEYVYGKKSEVLYEPWLIESSSKSDLFFIRLESLNNYEEWLDVNSSLYTFIHSTLFESHKYLSNLFISNRMSLNNIMKMLLKDRNIFQKEIETLLKKKNFHIEPRKI